MGNILQINRSRNSVFDLSMSDLGEVHCGFVTVRKDWMYKLDVQIQKKIDNRQTVASTLLLLLL